VKAQLLWLLLATAPIAIVAVAEPPNIDLVKRDLKAYHSKDYMTDIGAKIKEARDWVDQDAPQVKKPAVVLDIDETSLSNWGEIVANDFTFVINGPCGTPPTPPCGNIAWDQSTRATAIEPTLAFYQEATKLGVAVFFVTGRIEEPSERAATELNLWKVGYRGWAGLYMRQSKDRGSVAQFKTAARKKIEDLGFTIIANVGDQDSDLAGGHAAKWFKLPNPFYLIP
jgi:predicted secreted acid phosphatase